MNRPPSPDQKKPHSDSTEGLNINRSRAYELFGPGLVALATVAGCGPGTVGDANDGMDASGDTMEAPMTDGADDTTSTTETLDGSGSTGETGPEDEECLGETIEPGGTIWHVNLSGALVDVPRFKPIETDSYGNTLAFFHTDETLFELETLDPCGNPIEDGGVTPLEINDNHYTRAVSLGIQGNHLAVLANTTLNSGSLDSHHVFQGTVGDGVVEINNEPSFDPNSLQDDAEGRDGAYDVVPSPSEEDEAVYLAGMVVFNDMFDSRLAFGLAHASDGMGGSTLLWDEDYGPYGPDPYDRTGAFAIDLSNQGDVLLAGVEVIDDGGALQEVRLDGWLAMVNRDNGQETWHSTNNHGDITEYVDVSVAENGTIVAAGWDGEYFAVNPYNAGVIDLYNPVNGNLESSFHYEVTGASVEFHSAALVPIDNEGEDLTVIAAGSIQYDDGPLESLVVRMDGNLQGENDILTPVWSHTFIPEGTPFDDSWATDLAAVPGGGAVMVAEVAGIEGDLPGEYDGLGFRLSKIRL